MEVAVGDGFQNLRIERRSMDLPTYGKATEVAWFADHHIWKWSIWFLKIHGLLKWYHPISGKVKVCIGLSSALDDRVSQVIYICSLLAVVSLVAYELLLILDVTLLEFLEKLWVALLDQLDFLLRAYFQQI